MRRVNVDTKPFGTTMEDRDQESNVTAKWLPGHGSQSEAPAGGCCSQNPQAVTSATDTSINLPGLGSPFSKLSHPRVTPDAGGGRKLEQG